MSGAGVPPGGAMVTGAEYERQKGERDMEREGTVRNGVIVLNTPEPLPEGARVRVVVEETENKPTLAGLLKYAGVLPDMPPDFAEQHDHYIHGTPKR
jgi:hypothetical protein